MSVTRPRPHARLDAGPNMTPLVDVVMVILIFLMLAGSFGGAGPYLAANFRPKVAAADPAAPPSGGGLDAPLEIRVEAAGGTSAGGEPADGYAARVGDRVFRNDPKALAAALAGMRRRFEAAGAKVADLNVVISPGRSVKYARLIEVY